MPVPYNLAYFPVLLQGLIAMTIAGALILISFLLGKKIKNRVKDMPYECGMTPTGSARERFSVRFYLVGMLFIAVALALGAVIAIAGGVIRPQARWLVAAVVPAIACYVVAGLAGWYVSTFIVKPNRLSVCPIPHFVPSSRG